MKAAFDSVEPAPGPVRMSAVKKVCSEYEMYPLYSALKNHHSGTEK